MVSIESQADINTILKTVIDSGHSRFPVTQQNQETIVGILLAKDLLQMITQEKRHTQIEQLIRPAMFVPESKRLDAILREFRLNHQHMALVVDEYGAVSGFITIEDVLEQIVGDIEDEYDFETEEPFIQSIDTHHFMVNALTPIEDFNQHFGQNYSSEEFDTIGGMVLKNFQHFPKAGEKTLLEPFEVTVAETNARSLKWLEFKYQS
jgi:magnesium and cobalt transporter